MVPYVVGAVPVMHVTHTCVCCETVRVTTMLVWVPGEVWLR